MIFDIFKSIETNDINFIKQKMLYNRKELYNILINNLHIFDIPNINITIFNILLDHLDNNLNILDLNEKIIKILIYNRRFKHLTKNKFNNKNIVYYIIDYYLDKNLYIDDFIITSLIDKLVKIQYLYDDIIIIKKLYDIIIKNLNKDYLLFLSKTILCLSYGYNDNRYIYYCYGFENQLLDWCFCENKQFLIKYLMVEV